MVYGSHPQLWRTQNDDDDIAPHAFGTNSLFAAYQFCFVKVYWSITLHIEYELTMFGEYVGKQPSTYRKSKAKQYSKKKKHRDSWWVSFFPMNMLTHRLKLVSKTEEWSGDKIALLKSGPIKMF